MLTYALVTALLLALMAPPAWATCAWVLWIESSFGTARQSLHVKSAYPTYELCEAAKKRLPSEFEATNKLWEGSGDPQYWTLRLAECFPDTLDPRRKK
jgi:hypothetical protein